MRKYKIECDVDGVLADLYGSTSMKRYVDVTMRSNNVFTEDMLSEYSIKCLNNERLERTLRLAFCNPHVMGNLEPYPEVDMFIREITRIENVDFFVHTLMLGEHNTVHARKMWLERLMERTKTRFSYMIDLGTKSTLKGVDILIEDCPDNMERSGAKHKILVRHPYNESYAEEKRHKKNFHVVDDLNQCIDVVKSIVKN